MGYPKVTAHEGRSQFSDATQTFFETNIRNFIIPFKGLPQNFDSNVN